MQHNVTNYERTMTMSGSLDKKGHQPIATYAIARCSSSIVQSRPVLATSAFGS